MNNNYCKAILILTAIALLVFGGMGKANSELILTFNFTGTVRDASNIDGTGSGLGSLIVNVGDPVSGSFSYDAMTSDVDSDPDVGEYHQTLMDGINILIGGSIIEVSDYAVIVHNNYGSAGPFDIFEIQAFSNVTIDGSTTGCVQGEFDFVQAPGDTFNDDRLPDPSLVTNYPGQKYGHLLGCPAVDRQLFFDIETITAVTDTFCVGTSAELQTALTVSRTNGHDDLIKVQQGIYNGNFVYTSTEPYGLTIEGGYNPDCTERVVDLANTVLDGGSNGIVLLLSTPDDPAKFIVEGITFQNGYPQPSLQVITKYGEVTLNNNNISNNPRGGVYLSKIDKVTLNNNNISNNNYGGGIHLEYINTVTLNENIINNNDRIGGHVQYGGGIFGDSAGDVSLTNNTITNNRAGWGGGVFLKDSGIVTFTNNNISNNICESPGGGVRVRDAVEVNLVNNIINNNISTTAGGGGANITILGTAILTNNLISDNSAQSGGGADLNAGTAILTNNTIINNSTSQSGCGVQLIADTAILTNNTISNNSADNSAGSYGGGVRLALRPGGIANIYNNIIWNNNVLVGSGADLYINNDTDQDGFANGTVNLYNNDFDLSNGFFIQIDDDSVVYSDNLNNEDPKFDVDGYHLTKDSPCIDAGTETNAPDTDIDGDSRPQGAGYDIGADEYVYQNPIDAILSFFDSCVGETLFGNGPGNSADGRLNALRNMLVEAGVLIDSGEIEEACGQLMAAYRKCDGEPVDFATGPAAPELAGKIDGLIISLGCE